MAIGNGATFRMIFAMRIDVLALNDVFDLGLSAVIDAFQTANELSLVIPSREDGEESGRGRDGSRPPGFLAAGRNDKALRFDVRITGVRKSVKTAQGLSVPVQPIGNRAPDCVVVPAIGFKMPEPLEHALARPDVRDATDALRQWSRRGAMMTAACIGTFVMAESGLLDHQRATTTWWLAPLFRKRYPDVTLEESNMIVKSDRFVTAGAALSHMDLALWIIRSVSPELAALTARYLIVDSRPSQSAYALSDHLAHADPIVQRFERWARGRLALGFSLDEAAKAAGASKRTLARRIRSVLGKTPLSYFQSLRVERAVHLLKTSDASVDEVAAQVGYADGATLRLLLRRQLNVGLREIRGAP